MRIPACSDLRYDLLCREIDLDDDAFSAHGHVEVLAVRGQADMVRHRADRDLLDDLLVLPIQNDHLPSGDHVSGEGPLAVAAVLARALGIHSPREAEDLVPESLKGEKE